MKKINALILFIAILFMGCGNKQRYQVVGTETPLSFSSYMILDTYTGKYEVIYTTPTGDGHLYDWEIDIEITTKRGAVQTLRDEQSN